MNAFGQAAAQSPAAPRASLGSVVGRILLHGVFLLIAVGCFAAYLHFKVGGLALVGLPVAGVVSGTPVLTRTAMAPFAVMGAAQALMHQNHPRNAKQAA